MARSSYVYVVCPFGTDRPRAAFTVKHELMTWIRRQMAGPEPLSLKDGVWRVPDGGTGAHFYLGDVGELTQEEAEA